MKKKLLVILIIMLILCITNFVLPLIFIGETESKTMLIVTIISGWVSGISTLIVGIITYIQAKNYNNENSKFIEKQFKIEQAKSIIQSRLFFVNNIKNEWNKFVEEVNPVHFANQLFVLKENVVDNIVIDEITKLISESTLKTTTLCCSIQNQILLDHLQNDKKDKLKELLENYCKKYREYVETISNSKDLELWKVDKIFNTLVNEMGAKFLEIINVGNEYIIKIDMDLNVSINYKIDDIDYLKEQYSAIKNTNN